MLIIRLFFWLVALTVIVLAVLVGIGNRTPVDITLAPLPLSLTVPLFLVVFVSLFLGLLLGWIGAQASAFRKRRRAAEIASQNDTAIRR